MSPYRAFSMIELYGELDSLTNQRVAAVEAGGDACYLTLIDQRLTPAQTELDRRLHRWDQHLGPNPESDWYETFRALAIEVRQRVDIRYPLNLCGWDPVRVSSKGADGPCPFCGGHDRFVVWPTSTRGGGWAWCRDADGNCGWSGDVIALYRDLENVSFARAVEDLASVAGVTLPQPDRHDLLILAGDAQRARTA